MNNKDYIIKKTQTFTRDQNVEILKYLIAKETKISESADGCRINLDVLSKKEVSLLKKKVIEIEKQIPEKYQI